jgi:acyl-CoA thioester hydrolase
VSIPPIEASSGPAPGVTSSRVSIRVRFAETDLMGIVHHANYLLYVEEARVEYLRRRGASYAEWIARGLHFPVVDARLRYRSAARFGDEIVVECWAGRVSRVSVRFDYRISRQGELLAEAYTTLCCIDDRERSPRRIPQEILDVIVGPESTGSDRDARSS